MVVLMIKDNAISGAVRYGLLAVIWTASGLWTPSARAVCAKVIVEGSADCGGLRATMDVSGCPAAHTVGKPEVKCADDKASIQVVTDKSTYAAQMMLGAEAWGKRKWELVGGVTETHSAEKIIEHAVALPPPRVEKAKKPEKVARLSVTHGSHPADGVARNQVVAAPPPAPAR